MSELYFSLLLLIAGLLTGVSIGFVSYLCFAVAGRLSSRTNSETNSLGITQLIGFIFAALISGSIFLLIVVIIAKWANGFPEWASNKKLFWVGVLGALIVTRLIDIYKKRRRHR